MKNVQHSALHKTTPLIDLQEITRSFASGENTVTVLKEISMTINKGEMVAIIGASGSGKSTLMNILGCLDHPTSGAYYFHGEDIGHYDSSQLAKLRREHFGFIFQRYHLLNSLDASGNVEVPAVYAGTSVGARHERSQDLLSSLGLEERLHYYPTQLSGGQQQRVSIARALMNGGEVILADEPTGALDSKSGTAVLEILQNLNERGQTIIIVTHDANVANYADRIIELKDGRVISDQQNPNKQKKARIAERRLSTQGQRKQSGVVVFVDRLINAFKMALISMSMQRMRTFLTMLGIIIGIASVVLVIALGRGTANKILSDINAMGTSTLTVYSGKGFGDMRSNRVRTLRPSDVNVLMQQEYIQSVTPVVSLGVMVRYRNVAVNANLSGVGAQFFDVQGYEITDGIAFDKQSELELRQEAVIDQDLIEDLFPNGDNPIGQVVVLDRLPVRIIGVATSKSQRMGGRNTLNVWIPYSSAMKRMMGQSYLSNISIRVKDGVDMQLAEKNVTAILAQLHGSKDFFIFNADTIREMVESTTLIMSIFITSIAVISLIVGGIGVMNIMLVSVAERTREIGMRMAVGARKSDIAQQFLIEAILVCVLGGVTGVIFALCVGMLINHFSTEFSLSFSMVSIIFSCVASSLIGIVFGYFPAKRASELAPIEALERS